MADTSSLLGGNKGYALSLFVALLGGLGGAFNTETGQMGGSLHAGN